MIATAIRNHLWECSEGRRLSAGPCDFTISQLTSSLKWHWLTCLLLPLISTVHASALREVFIISLNSTGFIAKGCLSLYYSRERRLIFFPISTFYRLPKTTFAGLLWRAGMHTHVYTDTQTSTCAFAHTYTHSFRGCSLEILFLQSEYWNFRAVALFFFF